MTSGTETDEVSEAATIAIHFGTFFTLYGRLKRCSPYLNQRVEVRI
jgi:hypothetical protein